MSSVVRAPTMASACSSRRRRAKRAANPRAAVAVERRLGPKRRPGEHPQAVARLPEDRGLAPLVAHAKRHPSELGAPAVAGLPRGARGGVSRAGTDSQGAQGKKNVRAHVRRGAGAGRRRHLDGKRAVRRLREHAHAAGHGLCGDRELHGNPLRDGPRKIWG